MRRAGQERGFISFVGLLILSVVSFFGVAAFTINEKEFETTRRFKCRAVTDGSTKWDLGRG